MLSYDDLSPLIVSTFLQGSYRRATAVKPNNGKRADVDIIIVTNLNKDYFSPHEAIDKFIPFVEKYYKGKYEVQGRSIGIKLSYVHLDIVITSAPSETEKQHLASESVNAKATLEDVEEWRFNKNWKDPSLYNYKIYNTEAKSEPEWKSEPLWIPDKDAECWIETDPLEQIKWTRDKNKSTNLHYVNVVKAIKWWRILRLTDLKYPKGYPVEHMVGDCCPDGIQSVAEGVTKTLENIIDKYDMYRNIKETPNLPDRGVPNHNVWKRVSVDDFTIFYDYVKEYSRYARQALDATSIAESVEYWQKLFGSNFPDPPTSKSDGGGYTKRESSTVISGGRFA